MNLLNALAHWLQPAPPPSRAVQEAIARIPAETDPRLNALGDLDQRLAGPVAHALDYCTALVAQLPPAVAVNARAFADDPMIHAMFASADDLKAMLGRSAAVRAFFDSGEHPFADTCFALLCMRRNQKTTLAPALHGTVLQPEAPRTVLYFSDHVLHGLMPTEAETRHKLQWVAFLSLLRGFGDSLAQQHAAREQLHATWQAERSSATRITHPDEYANRLVDLEQQLAKATARLAPDQVADALAAWLQAPEQHLYLRPCVVSVDRMGTIMPATDDAAAETLHCPELFSRDRRRWTITLAQLSCAEARDAIATQTQRELATRSLFW